MKSKMYKLRAAVIITLTNLLICSSFAQSPEKMSYQAVIRDASNNLVTNHAVGMQISILQGSPSGTAVYTETQTPTTNANGLVSIEIGGGTLVSGDFTTIDWANGPYFMKTETDPAGGTNYTITGTSQLLSVPYALHAKTAETVTGTITETDPVFTSWDKSAGISITESQISDLQGYLTVETDPGFNASAASGIMATDTANWNNKLDSYTETDPIFGASVASGITATDTANWNNKLDSYTETDPVFTAWDKDYADLSNKPTAISDFTMSANSQNITNLADPVNAQDAATKAYVDALKNIIYEELLDAGLNGIVKDMDGNTYKTIKIGNQVWMAENLKTTKFNDGTAIPLVTDSTAWGNLSTPGYCWYDNDSATYAQTYGALYNGYTVETGNLCPTGWHVPTDAEWTTLTDYLGGTSVAGGKLKETGTAHWNSPNTGATNETGFTALPGGNRYGNGTFDNIGVFGFWWSATEDDTNGVWYRLMRYVASDIFRDHNYKLDGFSVRCLRD